MSRARLFACLAAAAVGVVAATVGSRGPVATGDEPEETAPVASAPATVAGEPAAPEPVAAPRVLGPEIGAEAFAALPLSPPEGAALAELERLDPSGEGRVLAEFLLSGYHHEVLEGQMGASMTLFANERLARMARHPAKTISLIRAAMALPALAGPDLAYGRASLFAAAEHMPGQRAAAHELMREELATHVLPALPAPTPRGPDGEPAPGEAEIAAKAPFYTSVVAAHSTFLQTASGTADSVDGTVAAIRAQNDTSLRLRLARQLLDRQPETRASLLQALTAAGVTLELES